MCKDIVAIFSTVSVGTVVVVIVVVLSTQLDHCYGNFVVSLLWWTAIVYTLFNYHVQGTQLIDIHYTHTYTHRFNGPFPGQPRWAGTRKVKPVWILLKQVTSSGSGISWAICKSAPCSRQITTPAPDHSVFYRPDALPATQPTASKHWRH